MTIPDSTVCTAAGAITAGADCGTTNSGIHSQLSGDQYIAWLNPSASKAAAICESAQDFGNMITAMDEFCTDIGDYCSEENKAQIENLKSILNKHFESLNRVNSMRLDPE